MTTLVVHPADRPLVGSVPVPSDASIGHRALLLAAIADGDTRIAGFSRGEDNLTTAACLRALGVGITEPSPHEVIVSGVGLHGLRGPAGALECGSSGTTMRLICGLLAAQFFRSTLLGDEKLSRQPMMRVAAPLRQRGAFVEGRPDATRGGEITAPLVVGPLAAGRRLSRTEQESAIASSQVKTVLLLSGLYADGITLFKEPTVSRDHTERLLDVLGVPIRTVGTIVQLDPTGWNGRIPAFQLAIPGDLSAAAFLLVAAQIVPGSRVTTRGVGINPTRTGLLEIARDMGAGLTIEPQGERNGEPVAALHAWSAPLRAVAIGGETVPRAIDEIPIACALAARATGTTRLTFAEPLRAPASGAREGCHRIAALVRTLRAFGVACDERAEGLEIEGREGPLDGGQVDSGGDPRIAMTAAVLALAARGPTRVLDAACIAVTFPKFVATLRALGARIDVEA